MRFYEVVLILIAVLMALAYCGIGVAMIVQRIYFFETAAINIAIGVAFIGYGLFRGWRVFQKIGEFREM